jgi:predicted PurR-regulated permease PerM
MLVRRQRYHPRARGPVLARIAPIMSRPARRSPEEHESGDHERVVFAVVIATVAVVLLALLWALRAVLVLMYVCALLATGLSPLVRWIERRRSLAVRRRRPPRWLVILVLYGVVLGAVAGVAALVLPPLIAQARDLVARGPILVDRAQGFLDAHGLGGLRVRTLVPGLDGSHVVDTVLGTVTGIFGMLVTVVTIVVLTFYFLVEGEDLVAFWLRLVPHRRRPEVRAIAARVAEKVSAWMMGQLVLCTAIGASAGVALALLGVPFPYVLAIVAAIGEMIPYAGPLIAGMIATGLAGLAVSWHVGMATAAYFLVQQLVENNVIQPKVMSHQVGLSAATVIIAVLVGGALLGVVGAVLAVPTAAILQVTVHEATDVEP